MSLNTETKQKQTIDETLIGNTSLGQSGPGSNNNEGGYSTLSRALEQ